MGKLKVPDKEISDHPEEAVPRNIARFGQSLSMKGELNGEEDILIEGHFQGKINLKNNNILVRQKGKIEADIQAKNITIEGSVTGNINASGKVFISREGRMKGDITSPVISIMDGAQFKGSIKMGESLKTILASEEKQEAPPKKEEKRAKNNAA